MLPDTSHKNPAAKRLTNILIVIDFVQLHGANHLVASPFITFWTVTSALSPWSEAETADSNVSTVQTCDLERTQYEDDL